MGKRVNKVLDMTADLLQISNRGIQDLENVEEEVRLNPLLHVASKKIK